jgi:hypothetical protein
MKNILKIFQKFEVGYTQTCTFQESSTMWHPKGGHQIEFHASFFLYTIWSLIAILVQGFWNQLASSFEILALFRAFQ